MSLSKRAEELWGEEWCSCVCVDTSSGGEGIQCWGGSVWGHNKRPKWVKWGSTDLRAPFKLREGLQPDRSPAWEEGWGALVCLSPNCFGKTLQQEHPAPEGTWEEEEMRQSREKEKWEATITNPHHLWLASAPPQHTYAYTHTQIHTPRCLHLLPYPTPSHCQAKHMMNCPVNRIHSGTN